MYILTNRLDETLSIYHVFSCQKAVRCGGGMQNVPKTCFFSFTYYKKFFHLSRIFCYINKKKKSHSEFSNMKVCTRTLFIWKHDFTHPIGITIELERKMARTCHFNFFQKSILRIIPKIFIYI